jgi:hypothetical protein
MLIKEVTKEFRVMKKPRISVIGYARLMHKAFTKEQKESSKNAGIGIRLNQNTSGYSLSQIMAFAANDPQSIYRILESFVESTCENLALFRNYLNDRNYQPLPELAHKMIAMFRQLEAFQVVTLLTKIEGSANDKLTGNEWNDLGREFLIKTEHFIRVLCDEQSISAVTLKRNS